MTKPISGKNRLGAETPTSAGTGGAEAKPPPSGKVEYIGPWVHNAAFDAWGREAQLRALCEELCEAAAAVARLQNGKGTRLDVLEELVDIASLQASLYAELGTENEWESMRQEKRRKLVAKLGLKELYVSE